MLHINSIKFKNYKSFETFSVALSEFNILVGPNNAGKSTVIGSIKILAEGIRKARARKPVMIQDPNGIDTLGYEIDLSQVPVATENVFHNYNDDAPAIIRFRLSDASHLQLFFPQKGVCFMNYESDKVIVRTPKEFKKVVDLEIGFVPVLGPVDHEESLYQKEAARLALLTHKASRNFRNIWHHYPEDFEEFRELVQSTWPGLDIEIPEVDNTGKNPRLNMFCPEERIPREIYWAGFGFQVWCQMLTYIIKNKESTLFLIDEPDIYLHSDLQRQLLSILKNLGPDVIIATHSTELISEADLNDILIINKNLLSAKRIKDPSQLQKIFNILGSNLNPVLTQIAKTKRVLFVEGKDYTIFSKFARRLNLQQVANRADFAVVSVGGFSPTRLRDLKEGIEKTIGSKIVSAVIFDRDFRSENEVNELEKDLKKGNSFSHIHSSKEIENYLLVPDAIQTAIEKKLDEYNKRTGEAIKFEESARQVMDGLSESLKIPTQAQLQSHQLKFERSYQKDKREDESIVIAKILTEFDSKWNEFHNRLRILPGKEFLSRINEYLQNNYKISLTSSNIVDSMSKVNVPDEMKNILIQIEEFRKEKIE